MNNFYDHLAARFLHESVINRFNKLLAMQRRGAATHLEIEEEIVLIKDEDIIINP